MGQPSSKGASASGWTGSQKREFDVGNYHLGADIWFLLALLFPLTGMAAILVFHIWSRFYKFRNADLKIHWEGEGESREVGGMKMV
jgi:hypothetical protein